MKHSNALILILGLMITSNCCGFPSRKRNGLDATPGYEYRDDINENDGWLWPNNDDDFARKFGLNKKEGSWDRAMANASPDNEAQNPGNDDGFKDFDDQDETEQVNCESHIETQNPSIARMLLGDIFDESNEKISKKKNICKRSLGKEFQDFDDQEDAIFKTFKYFKNLKTGEKCKEGGDMETECVNIISDFHNENKEHDGRTGYQDMK